RSLRQDRALDREVLARRVLQLQTERCRQRIAQTIQYEGHTLTALPLKKPYVAVVSGCQEARHGTALPDNPAATIVQMEAGVDAKIQEITARAFGSAFRPLDNYRKHAAKGQLKKCDRGRGRSGCINILRCFGSRRCEQMQGWNHIAGRAGDLN